MKDNLLTLYKTEPHACSYIENNEAITLYIDPLAEIDQTTHTYLSEQGFRRSGPIIYKPHCMHCQECISIRIPVNAYIFSRKERRVLQKNSDLDVFAVEHIHHDDFYQLYANYIKTRHADGDMYPPNREQYDNFFSNPFGNTQFIVFKKQHEVKAIAIIDKLNNGLSAVYTFFDPHDDKRSLGTLAVLWQIQQARTLQLPFVYLGYWVKHCQKMRYKTTFTPSEIYFNKQWITLIHKEA